MNNLATNLIVFIFTFVVTIMLFGELETTYVERGYVNIDNKVYKLVEIDIEKLGLIK